MKLKSLLQKFIIVLNLWALALSERYYSVIAPGTLKSNRNYTVCLTLHTPGEPAIVRVALLGEPLFYFKQNVELQPFESKLIDFMPPKLDTTNKYQLLIEGVKGINFRNITNLLADDDDGLYIYIQTDKGKYKPGDLVQFRILILDEHLKPFKSIEPIKVQVMDGKRNRIKQFKDIQLNTGVFTSKFQLSEHPVMGRWQIIVSISGKYNFAEGKSFQVERYILPKFSVFIEGQMDYLLGSPTMSIEVYAKYTYGRYVEGSAIIELIHPHTNETISVQEMPIQNQRAQFTLDLSQMQRLADFMWIGITATVMEKHTGLKQATLQHVNIRQKQYEIIVPEEDIEFHNNVPYKMSAYVQYWNGSRVIDPATPMLMEHGNRTYRAVQNSQGVATFTFQYELNDNIIFSYKTSKTVASNIFIKYNFRLDKSARTQCTLKINRGKLKFGTTIEIELSSLFDIPYIVYTVTSHASIVRLQSIRLPAGQKSYIISLKPAIDMLPRSHIYVHYVERGELRYCELKLRFPYEFENKVSIDAPHTAKPGENVSLSLMAEPNTFVGLLAVDLSVHLLNSNYNFDKMEIFSNLLYDQTFLNVALIYPGQLSGLLTLTNAHFVYEASRETTSTVRSSNHLNPINAVDSLEIRSKFPETWIFMDLNVTEPLTHLNFNVPDTITTWLITAFSVSPITGFGMMNYPTNLTVFKTFFINTNLPYSIRRGELVKISFIVFNYHSKDLETSITMKKTGNDFEFISDQNENMPINQNSKLLNVPANGGLSDCFMIKALKLGLISIHLEAVNHMFQDAVIQKLKVEPEGQIQQSIENVYVDLPGMGQTYKKTFKINVPLNVVPASEFMQLSFGGSALASILENLEELVKLPTGCGEQNMINLAPNILIVDYLKSLAKSFHNDKLKEKALSFIQQGYQQELTYRHESGGFSVFGPEAKTDESTWLTAYVIRFFIKATRYAGIESHIVESGLEYLAEMRQEEGDFTLTGHLFYPAHQNRYGFTAFVLMTFLESPKYAKKYKSLIQKSIDFLIHNLNSIEDTYALSIMATALQMAKNQYGIEVLNKLMTKAHQDDGYKWWTSSETGHNNDVEITAYVLMASLDLLPNEDHVSIYRWLIKQRSKEGGFHSTHDTVVGLQALIKYSQKYPSRNDTMLKVDFIAEDKDNVEISKGVFGIDPSNIMILQHQELLPSTRSIKVQIEGRGSSILQLSYHYFISPSTINMLHRHNSSISTRGAISIGPRFATAIDRSTTTPIYPPDGLSPEELKTFHITTLAKMDGSNILQMEICFEFKPLHLLKYRKSNMVIMEITLPSGFIANADAIADVQDENFIARTELKNEDTLIFIYFENLKVNADEKYLSLKADKIHEVQMLKATSIVMYDYYNVNYRDAVFYEIQY